MAAREAQGELGFSLEALKGILRRRIAWFAIPTAAGAFLGLLVAVIWPAEYEAVSTLVIQPQGVPEHLIVTTVSEDTESRYSQIRAQILARDNLARIMREFDVYPDMLGSVPTEKIIEIMREKITIEPLPPAIIDPRKPVEIDSFMIAFRSRDPIKAAQVANRLTTDFRDENRRQRSSQATGTTSFVDSELERAESERARLLQELISYSEQHSGEMPGDLLANQARLEHLQNQERDARTQLQLAQAQVREIRAQILEVRTQGSDRTSDPVARSHALELLINQGLAQGKTEKHPDIVIARAELAQLKAMLAERVDTDAPLSPAETVLRTEVRTHEVHVGVLRSKLTELAERITEIELRIGATPSRTAVVSQLDAQLTGVNAQIIELHGMKIAADLGEQVELVEKGQKFRVIDTAQVPSSPVSPNRPLVFLVGLVVGFGLGLLLLVVREMSDESFHSVEDLQSELGLPVLGSIPVIELTQDRATSRARLRRFAITGAVLLAIGLGSSLVAYALQSGLGAQLAAWLDVGDADV